MSAERPVTAADGGTLEHEFIGGADTPDRLANAFLRYNFTRPWVVVVGVVLVAAVVVVVLLERVSWLPAVIGLMAGAGTLWIIGLVQRRKLVRQLRSVAGEGKRITLVTGPDSLSLTLALSEGTIDYRAFESAIVSGPAVLLKTRDANTQLVLPIELFPPDTLQFVQERIAAQ